MPELVDESKTAKPIHKPVNQVWIPLMDSLDKDLVMEQRQGRPFEVIQTLPLSREEPDYGSLVNKLSMKDSATLYNSLIVSRHNWANYVFDAYWSRKEQYGNTAASDRKRDKMSKLCDSKIYAGPHSFDIRLFILKDEEKEKKRLDEIEKRREAKKKAQAVQMPVGGTQPVGVQSGGQMGGENRTEQQSVGAAPVVGSPVVQKTVEQCSNEAAIPPSMAREDGQVDTDTDAQKPGETETSSDKNLESSASKDATPEAVAETESQAEAEAEADTEAKTDAKTEAETEMKSSKADDTTKSTASVEIQKPIPPISRMNNAVTASKPPQISAPRPKLPIPPPQRPVSQARSDIMSSPENHIMISNLNTIARTDPSLNALMKIVASGNATHDQILQFQKYIQKAKEMGDVNGYYKKWQEQQQQLQLQQRLQLQRHNEQIRQQQLNQAKANAVPKEEKLTAFQERYLTDATIVFEFHENTAVRFYLPKNAIVELHEKPETEAKKTEGNEEKKEDTQQQEKQSETENDKGKNDDSESSSKPETAEGDSEATKAATQQTTPPKMPASTSKKQKKSPFVPEIIISFLSIHNQYEIDEFDRLKREEEERVRREEEEEKKRREEEEEERKKQAEAESEQSQKESDQPESPSSAPKKKPHRKAKRWSVTRRSTRQQSQSHAEVKKEEKETEVKRENEEKGTRPAPQYSCITIKLTDVPLRFFPMIKNSVNPQKEVLEYMEEIRKTGKKAEEMNVWFHLDGAKDELLAETLRYNLNRLDYMNGGGKLKGKAMLKRLTERSEIDSTPAKKPKN
ncbi:unnamed protein product [Kuraishia capsulata CBS 1993]|uniref:SWR1-complex protein 3 n=1 Tax=Kuraishia capsulata CBS 1993 TaxID=1382522 RepID=W6MSP7_9ASCO|nr:uncharacterized protein KUCA_T00005830001 [Kuraishia capsulata CBS 1993]CDK29836.1 unnamed protein product [Kuraishia capsulata CBS 1993]